MSEIEFQNYYQDREVKTMWRRWLNNRFPFAEISSIFFDGHGVSARLKFPGCKSLAEWSSKDRERVKISSSDFRAWSKAIESMEGRANAKA